jgi:hypothetical protein
LGASGPDESAGPVAFSVTLLRDLFHTVTFCFIQIQSSGEQDMSIADAIAIFAFFAMVISAKTRNGAWPALIFAGVFLLAGLFTDPGVWLLNTLIHLHVSSSTAGGIQ